MRKRWQGHRDLQHCGRTTASHTGHWVSWARDAEVSKPAARAVGICTGERRAWLTALGCGRSCVGMSTFPWGCSSHHPVRISCGMWKNWVRALHHKGRMGGLEPWLVLQGVGRRGCQALGQHVGLAMEGKSPMAKGACRPLLACSVNVLLCLVVRKHPTVNQL